MLWCCTLKKLSSKGHYNVVIIVAIMVKVTTNCHNSNYIVVIFTTYFLQCGLFTLMVDGTTDNNGREMKDYCAILLQ